MIKISEEKFDQICQDGKVLERDGHGDKVILTKDRKICKIFRCKRAISTARFYPYANRFQDNAESLNRMGIPCVEVEGVFRVPSKNRDIVVYPLLEGETLRDFLRENPDQLSEKVSGLANFIAILHEKGVYFRSLHFGNVLVLPSGEFGLIDVSDMKIYKKALSLSKRARNFKAVLRYEEDIQHLENFGGSAFFDKYVESARLEKAKVICAVKKAVDHAIIDKL
ncbi:MAG: hypothetical protein NE330_02525 [Lentisphaeraceae bacterium]|nr:hypothetical protein [Lentisphaeraceae bacterium]